MSAAAKENCILRKEPTAALDRNTDPECIAAALAGVAGSMGGQLRGCVDAIAQKGGEISSLARLLPTYTAQTLPREMTRVGMRPPASFWP